MCSTIVIITVKERIYTLLKEKLSENQKKMFFTVIWGDLGGAGLLYPPPTLKLHSLLGLRVKTYTYMVKSVDKSN